MGRKKRKDLCGNGQEETGSQGISPATIKPFLPGRKEKPGSGRLTGQSRQVMPPVPTRGSSGGRWHLRLLTEPGISCDREQRPHILIDPQGLGVSASW